MGTDAKRAIDAMMAVSMRVNGKSFDEISKTLGVRHITARHMYEQAMADMIDDSVETAKTMRAVESMRLDNLLERNIEMFENSSTDKAKGAALERMRKVIETRIKLHGLSKEEEQAGGVLSSFIRTLNRG